MREKIKEANKWCEEKAGLGWKNTCMGWLPPEEIEAAGLTYNEDSGTWAIPTQSYIADGTSPGTRKGVKYTGASRQFLDWLNKKRRRETDHLSVDDKIDKEIKSNLEKQGMDIVDKKPTDEIIVEDIPF